MIPPSHTLPSIPLENAPAFSGHSFSTCGKRAFTLIEVISVMVVMVLVLTIAVGSHLMWRRHNALDASDMLLHAHLSLARQHAITAMRPTTVTLSNAHNRAWIDLWIPRERADDTRLPADIPVGERIPIGNPARTLRTLLWCEPTGQPRELQAITEPVHLTFLPDGSRSPPENTTLWMVHDLAAHAATNALLRRAVEVHGPTGLARSLSREERETLLAAEDSPP